LDHPDVHVGIVRENLVLNNRPADRAPEHVVVLRLSATVVGNAAPVFRVEDGILVVFERVTVPPIAPALGNGANYPPGAPSVLGVKHRCLDADFLNGIGHRVE
jgi:hypothetical protein